MVQGGTQVHSLGRLSVAGRNMGCVGPQRTAATSLSPWLFTADHLWARDHEYSSKQKPRFHLCPYGAHSLLARSSPSYAPRADGRWREALCSQTQKRFCILKAQAGENCRGLEGRWAPVCQATRAAAPKGLFLSQNPAVASAGFPPDCSEKLCRHPRVLSSSDVIRVTRSPCWRLTERQVPSSVLWNVEHFLLPLSHVQLFCDPMDYAHQAPLSVEFPRQEYWSGLPFPFPGDLPNPGIEPRVSCRWTLYHWATREAHEHVGPALKLCFSAHFF